MYKASDYKALIKKHTKKSPVAKNTARAFIFGGTLCLLGEALSGLFVSLGSEREESYIWVSVCVIFLSALLTALGVFDRIAKHAGAGTLVPVSGFANSVVSSALDSRNEGLVIGLGSGIFTVAGPVILYATVSGVLYGVVYFIAGLLFA